MALFNSDTSPSANRPRVGDVCTGNRTTRRATSVKVHVSGKGNISMKVACWNMRCKFDLQRVGSALETGNFDILMLSDCQPRRMPAGEVEVASLDVSLPESAGTAFTVVYSRCVAIATRYKILKHTLSASGRILWADCMCERNERIRIVAVYVPPATPNRRTLCERTFGELEEVVCSTPDQTELICGGDLNSRTGFDLDGGELGTCYGRHCAGGTNANSDLLLDLMITCKLKLPATFIRRSSWVRRWTWRNPKTKRTSEIDHFLTRQKGRAIYHNVRARSDLCPGSDHRVLVAQIVILRQPKRHIRQQASYSPLSLLAVDEKSQEATLFRARLQDLASLTDPPQQGLKRGLSMIEDVALQTFPRRIRPRVAWISEEAIALRQKLATEETKLRGRRLTRTVRHRVKQLRRRAERVTRKDFRRAVKTATREAELAFQSGNIAEMYAALKKIPQERQTTTHRQIPPIVHEGSRIYDPGQAAELFASHLLQPPDGRATNAPPPNFSSEPWPTIPHSPLTRDDIRQALATLKSQRSPGPDGITAEVLRAGGEPIIEWLYSIVEPLWSNMDGSEFPIALAETTIVPIQKKGKDPTRVESYRPITLTSHILKLIEHVALNRIQEDMSSRIGSYQSGFVKDRQLAEHILSLRVLNEQAKANSEHFYGVFMDLKGAYDRVDRNILFRTLEHYGINQELLNLLASIYSHHTFRVRHRGKRSKAHRMRHGVMQGSKVSPLLFNIYLDAVIYECVQRWKQNCTPGLLRYPTDIQNWPHGPPNAESDVPFELHVFAYADDVVLLSTEFPQDMVCIFEQTCERFSLKIAPDKCAWTFFGRGNLQGPHPLLTNLTGEEIPYGRKTKYLGVFLDEEAADHVILENRRRSAWKVYFKLRRILSDKRLPIKMRLQLLHQTVFASYLFGCEVLTLRRTETIKAQSFESRLYRLLFNDFDSERESIRQRVSDLLPNHLWLCQRIRLRRLTLLGHILRGKSLCRQILLSANGQQQRGRPKSFLKQIAEDIIRVQLVAGTSNLSETIGDRNRYRAACVSYIRENGDLGRLRCPMCRKEYITERPYTKHLRTHDIVELTTTATTPTAPPQSFPTEPILQSDQVVTAPRRSARIAARLFTTSSSS